MVHQKILVALADVLHMLRGIIADFRNFFVCHPLAITEMKNTPINRIDHILVNGVAHVAASVHRNLQKENAATLPPCFNYRKLKHKGMSGGSILAALLVLSSFSTELHEFCQVFRQISDPVPRSVAHITWLQ